VDAALFLGVSFSSTSTGPDEGGATGFARRGTSLATVPPQTNVISLQHLSHNQNRSYSEGGELRPTASTSGVGVSWKIFPWWRYRNFSEHSGLAHFDTIGARLPGDVKTIIIQMEKVYGDAGYGFG
jgi:hypothetical protein